MKRSFMGWGVSCLIALTRVGFCAEGDKPEAKPDVGGQSNVYLVIDLTQGAAKNTFPVRYLADVPSGGWTDEYKTTKLVLRRVPAGTFLMGSPNDELGRDSDEAQHAVTITKDFYIGVFEVTMRQWELVMGKPASGYHNLRKGNDFHYPSPAELPELHRRPVEQITFYEIRENPMTDAKEVSAALAESSPAPALEPKKPAADKNAESSATALLADEDDEPPDIESDQEREAREKQAANAKKAAQYALEQIMAQPSHDPNVDWPANSAVNPDSFFGKLRAKTMLAGLDLPTEAQWEYACRAGATTALNSGKALTQVWECPNLAEVGRYLLNVDSSEGWYYRYEPLGSAVVGSYAPNTWDLYDMHGNVWEWCLDWYEPLSSEPAVDPKGPATGKAHVLRGGDWDDRAKACRAANRGQGGVPSNKNAFFGFRAAMTAP